MNDLPSGPRGRMLALCLTVAVLAAIWVGVAQPLLTWYEDRGETLDERRAYDSRLHAIVQALPELRQRAGAMPAQGAGAVGVIDGTSDALVAATLQERVQALAARAGTSFASLETLPAQSVGAYRRIALRVALSATYGTVVALLRACDEAAPRLLVDDLRIQPSVIVGRPADAPMDVGFTVIGFRLGASPPPPAAPR